MENEKNEKVIKVSLTLSVEGSEEWENEYERGTSVPLSIEGRVITPRLTLPCTGRVRMWYTSSPEEGKEVGLLDLSLLVEAEDLQKFSEEASLLAEVMRKAKEEISAFLMDFEEGDLPDILGLSLLYKFKEEVIEHEQ